MIGISVQIVVLVIYLRTFRALTSFRIIPVAWGGMTFASQRDLLHLHLGDICRYPGT